MNENENGFKSRDESVKGRIDWISDASEMLNVIIKLSFVFGSLLLFCYFISIRYVPFMALGISGIGWIVFLIFILGLVLVAVMGFSFLGPGFLLGLYVVEGLVNFEKKIENTRENNRKLKEFFCYTPFLFLILSYLFTLFVGLLLLLLLHLPHPGYWPVIFLLIILLIICILRNNEILKTSKKSWFWLLALVAFDFVSLSLTFIFLPPLINALSSHVFYIIVLLILLVISNFAIVKVSVDLKKSDTSVNAAFMRKEFFKRAFPMIIVIPVMVLLFLYKFYVLSYFPIKQLRLGQINIKLKLNNCIGKCYLRSLKNEFCSDYSNSKKDDFCSSLSEHSVLKGFLLFRTPSKYIIRIEKNARDKNKKTNNTSKKDSGGKAEKDKNTKIKESTNESGSIIVVDSKFVEFPIFPDNSKRTK